MVSFNIGKMHMLVHLLWARSQMEESEKFKSESKKEGKSIKSKGPE
jgi:hypothetical protein